MRMLLDTHILLWALIEPRKLTPVSAAAIENPNNEVLFSAASIWEIAIKSALGRADFGVQPEDIAKAAVDSGFTELPVRAATALLVAKLPLRHRDPFDRLLIAQAISEPANLYTADAQLEAYSELVKRI